MLAAGTAVRLITGPVISRLADRLGKHRSFHAWPSHPELSRADARPHAGGVGPVGEGAGAGADPQRGAVERRVTIVGAIGSSAVAKLPIGLSQVGFRGAMPSASMTAASRSARLCACARASLRSSSSCW